MLGETVRATRHERGLTQARLAKLAGVSRRHLAALEKGANVTILVLSKVAAVLELAEVSLGDVTVRTAGSAITSVNLPLLAETIREARTDALHAQTLLARAESILEKPDPLAALAEVVRFPKVQPLMIDGRKRRRVGSAIADGRKEEGVPVVAEIRQGEAPIELDAETVPLPASLIDRGERVFRARGDGMRPVGIQDGDLLIAELRTTGRAASGELVIAKAEDRLFIGHWWQKQGRKSVMTDGFSEIATGGKSPKSALRVMAAINAIVRTR